MIKKCEQKIFRRSKTKTLSMEKRKKGFNPVEFGLGRGKATEEAQRCLGLRECESCDLCSLLCPDLCITRDQKTGEVLVDLDYCKGCGICAAICPKKAIEMVQDMSGD
jgi:2-oxoacid:acceptor oxidoreductase delta subunit (pyruvate/2-ketoisovalerate family)